MTVNTEMPPDESEPRTSPTRWGVLVILALLALGSGLLLRTEIQPPQSPLVGQPAPVLRVASWLNGPGPTPGEYHGKVMVIEAWAYWCAPCEEHSPYLVSLYEKYHPQGVMFIGLTSEQEDSRAQSQAFLDRNKIKWPNGLGADATLLQLHADAFPQMWIVDQHGKIAWHDTSPIPPDQILDQLLAAAPAQ